MSEGTDETATFTASGAEYIITADFATAGGTTETAAYRGRRYYGAGIIALLGAMDGWPALDAPHIRVQAVLRELEPVALLKDHWKLPREPLPPLPEYRSPLLVFLPGKNRALIRASHLAARRDRRRRNRTRWLAELRA